MNQESESKHTKRIFGDRFLVKKRISAGSFGVVYLCADQQTKDYIALKVDKNEEEQSNSLDREIQVLEALQDVQGIPRLIWYSHDSKQNCMALQLLGRDLAYHLKHFKKLSLKCVVNIGDQVLQILEQIHKRGIIHRDLKPENLITGRETESDFVYLVDFGISKFYKDDRGQHIPFQANKPFIGTTRYAALAAHQGYELGRKDDLESFGYVLIYFLKGVLPWQNIVGNSEKEKTKLVGQMKEKIQMNELCKDLPSEFQKYLNYVRNLQFKSSPDYKYLAQLFMKIAVSNNFQIDRKLDWTDNNGTKKKLLKQSTNQSDRKKFDKKSSFNELSSLGSQNLVLDRQNNRQGTQGTQESGKSSVFLNYPPSVQPKIKSKLFSRIEQRLTYQSQFISNRDIQSKRSSMFIEQLSQDMLPQTEGFQDLEALQFNKKGRSKQLIGEVKKILQNDDSFSKDLMDAETETEGIQNKIEQINGNALKIKMKGSLHKN